MFALMQKVKVTMPGERDSAGDSRTAEEVADQLGISIQQVKNMVAKHVATVVPRAFGIKVVDRQDPVFRTDPDRARNYIAHLLTANTELPAETEPEIFRTIDDNQRQVKLEVWEQAGSVASEELEHNTHIGEGSARGICRPDRPGRHSRLCSA